MTQKMNLISVRRMAEQAAARDEQNRRIEFAATHTVPEVLGALNAIPTGLDALAVEQSRAEHGSNHVTREKKKGSSDGLAVEGE